MCKIQACHVIHSFIFLFIFDFCTNFPNLNFIFFSYFYFYFYFIFILFLFCFVLNLNWEYYKALKINKCKLLGDFNPFFVFPFVHWAFFKAFASKISSSMLVKGSTIPPKRFFCVSLCCAWCVDQKNSWNIVPLCVVCVVCCVLCVLCVVLCVVCVVCVVCCVVCCVCFVCCVLCVLCVLCWKKI